LSGEAGRLNHSPRSAHPRDGSLRAMDRTAEYQPTRLKVTFRVHHPAASLSLGLIALRVHWLDQFDKATIFL
jgi:hypothetical protein